jgi:hypothetical protein
MYADPYLIAIVSRAETQQRSVRLERARIAKEHPERLVATRPLRPTSTPAGVVSSSRGASGRMRPRPGSPRRRSA